MGDIVQGVLAGIAIGGLTAAVVKGNALAVMTLMELNALATETICIIANSAWKRLTTRRSCRQWLQQHRQQQQQQRQQRLQRQRQQQQADDESESET